MRNVLAMLGVALLVALPACGGNGTSADPGVTACGHLAKLTQTAAPTRDAVKQIEAIGDQAAKSTNAGLATSGTQTAATARTALAFWNDDQAFAVRQFGAAIDNLASACQSWASTR